MKNREIVELRTKVEAGQSLTNDQQLLVLHELLRANRRLLKAKDAGFVIKEKPKKTVVAKPKKGKDSAPRMAA
jgi:hypothetical protein